MWNLFSYPKINLHHRNFEIFAVPVTAGPWLEGLARNCPSVSVADRTELREAALDTLVHVPGQRTGLLSLGHVFWNTSCSGDPSPSHGQAALIPCALFLLLSQELSHPAAQGSSSEQPHPTSDPTEGLLVPLEGLRTLSAFQITSLVVAAISWMETFTSDFL